MIRDILTFGKNSERPTKDDWVDVEGQYFAKIAGEEKTVLTPSNHSFSNPLMQLIARRYNVVPTTMAV